MAFAVLVAGALVALIEAAVSAAALDVDDSGVSRGSQEEGGKELNELHGACFWYLNGLSEDDDDIL